MLKQKREETCVFFSLLFMRPCEPHNLHFFVSMLPELALTTATSREAGFVSEEVEAGGSKLLPPVYLLCFIFVASHFACGTGTAGVHRHRRSVACITQITRAAQVACNGLCGMNICISGAT